MTQRTDILTPPGRLVQGDLYKPNTTDAEGKPLVSKSGQNIGQPRLDYYFALAIPKGAEQHWSQTPWGQIIYNAGRLGFPQAHLSSTFAWKVKDGDSPVANRRGKRPCDQEGFPRHWVLSFSSGYPPKLSRNNGTEPILEPGAVKLGYWVQVFGSVGDNGSQTQPGVFLNHSMVNLIGYDKEIVVGPDAASVGFGQGVAVPSHVSATPLAGSFNPTTAAPAGFPGVAPVAAGFPGVAPAAAGFPGVAAAPAGFPGVAPAAAAFPGVPPVVVQPHPGFLTPAAVPPMAPVRQMTAKAGGAPYEAFIREGWNDTALIQQGYMTA